MRPPETFLGQPIRDLQTMLRVIDKAEGRENALIPDGIYGHHTAKAIAGFQQQHDLPVTGVTDLNTWEAVLSAFTPANIRLIPACPLHILLDPNQVICKGQQHPHLFLVQAMLMALSQKYRSVKEPSFSGALDIKTEGSLCSFQTLCSLPVTGTVDKITWKHLALQYPLAADLILRKNNKQKP